MDSWLTDEIKEQFFKPCLNVTGAIGQRLDNRLRMGQDIDERALTELLVDSFDTSSSLNVWGNIVDLLRDNNISLNTSVRKSTREHINGADIGLVINRHIYQQTISSQANYAALIQCKKVNSQGTINDFFHTVKSSGKSQSDLMLDITPNSYYFVFVPPSFIKTYSSIEPIAFSIGNRGCSSPIWNMGCFGYEGQSIPFLSGTQKAEVASIVVVPALAVEAQRTKGKSIKLENILPNSIPLWYWFGELLIPGFIGDKRQDVLDVASNTSGNKNIEEEFGVRYSVNVDFGNG